MLPIADELHRVDVRPCKYARILAAVPDEDRQALLDTTAGNAQIARVLRRHGFAVSEKAVRVHRNKDCGCESR